MTMYKIHIPIGEEAVCVETTLEGAVRTLGFHSYDDLLIYIYTTDEGAKFGSYIAINLPSGCNLRKTGRHHAVIDMKTKSVHLFSMEKRAHSWAKINYLRDECVRIENTGGQSKIKTKRGTVEISLDGGIWYIRHPDGHDEYSEWDRVWNRLKKEEIIPDAIEIGDDYRPIKS